MCAFCSIAALLNTSSGQPSIAVVFAPRRHSEISKYVGSEEMDLATYWCLFFFVFHSFCRFPRHSDLCADYISEKLAEWYILPRLKKKKPLKHSMRRRRKKDIPRDI